ncbi:hypothetical protein AVEN_100899-1 [Araneus ventricosus]|uniref:RNase H type-1 domain-containing protein n=1 Tax=Araneus ventricosus TaxID=182803 RepID=A0A4Y2AXQ5_ARAVE|nr:hypothetical protein AVEN_100899-1 [Araneus ventricosus]
MAASNPKTTIPTARKFFQILLDHPKINVTWVKEHVRNFGNEKADQLAKTAMQNGQSYTDIKLPKSFIKILLRKAMVKKWQVYWNEGGTGRSVFNIIPKVCLHPMNWVREDIIFSTEHDPFRAYLKRFGILTQRLLHMGRYWNSTPLCHRVHSHDLMQERLWRVASNNLSRHIIQKIIQFIFQSRSPFGKIKTPFALSKR